MFGRSSRSTVHNNNITVYLLMSIGSGRGVCWDKRVGGGRKREEEEREEKVRERKEMVVGGWGGQGGGKGGGCN